MSATPITVAAGIIRRGGETLACRRRADQDHAGKWEFPGGKVEAGETPEQCLRRELREELEIEVRGASFLCTLRHDYPGRPPVELHFFSVSEFAGEPRNRVFAEIRWVRAEALADLDFLAADRAVVRRLAAEIG